MTILLFALFKAAAATRVIHPQKKRISSGAARNENLIFAQCSAYRYRAPDKPPESAMFLAEL
jgi:hypothetical protein